MPFARLTITLPNNVLARLDRRAKELIGFDSYDDFYEWKALEQIRRLR